MSPENHFERIVREGAEAQKAGAAGIASRKEAAEKVRADIRKWRVVRGEAPVQPVRTLPQIREERRRLQEARGGTLPEEIWDQERADLCKEFLNYVMSLSVDPRARTSYRSEHNYPIGYSKYPPRLEYNSKQWPSAFRSPPHRPQRDVFLCQDGYLRTPSNNLPIDDNGEICEPVIGNGWITIYNRHPGGKTMFTRYGDIVEYREVGPLSVPKYQSFVRTDLKYVLEDLAQKVAAEAQGYGQ